MKTVVFLEYFEDLECVIPLIRNICKKLESSPILVSSNIDIKPLADRTGLEVIYFEGLLSEEDYKFMYKYVFDLTQEWYMGLKRVEDVTEYKGIRLGTLVEETAHRFFSFYVKNIEIILKIVEILHPDRFFLIGKKDFFLELSLFIKEELSIPSAFIETKEKGFTGKIITIFRSLMMKAVHYICDNLIRQIVVLKKKRDDGIFLDARLYVESGEIVKSFPAYPYVIEKGMRLRLQLLKKEGLLFAPFLTDESFILPEINSRFSRYWEFINQDAKFIEKFVYRDFSIWRIARKRIKFFLTRDFRRIRKNIKFLDKIYRFLMPKAIILREAVREVEKTIVLTAKVAGISTLVIQHGALVERNVYTRLYSDKIALWGKNAMEWYVRYGNDEKKCVVTGRLQHDRIYSEGDNKAGIDETLLKIGADQDKDTILYIGHTFRNVRNLSCVYYTYDSEYPVLNSIFSIAKKFPNKQWIIKIHPFDPIDINLLYNLELQKHPNVFIVKNIDTLSLLRASSLVIASYFSSATLDAVILNKLVIALKLDKGENLSPMSDAGVALSINDLTQLPCAIKQIFEDKNTQDSLASNRGKFIYDYAYKIDGNATMRVIELVKQCANLPRGKF